MRFRFLIYSAFLFAGACRTPNDIKNGAGSKSVATVDTSVQRMERKTYRAAYTMLNDLVHTKLEVKPDWQKKYLYGQATITLQPHFYPTDSVALNARGMVIEEVALVNKKNEHLKLNYTYGDSLVLHIKLDREYKRDESYTLFIKYISKPDELPEGGSAAITRDKGLYFINADGSDPEKPKEIWTQGETESNSAWFPTIEDPQQKMTQEIYITVDSSYLTLSNGLLITSTSNPDGTRTDYWKQSLPAAPYLTMFAVGKFAVIKDKWRTIELSYYVEPEYEKYARMIFGRTPQMMEFFSEKLGVPYAWEKYSQMVVRDYVSGAMENTTAVIHREALQQNAREYLDGNYEDYIAHELFHHWFGDLVTCESWSNMPLNEGFANYGEYLWFEHQFGRDEADHQNQVNQARYLNRKRNDPDVIRFDYDDREDMYDAISYAKGGRILHMLRKYVGDDAFFASLHEYLTAHRFSSVEIHDLRLAFEKITGEDLNWFFNEWYLNRGRPSLQINYSWNENSKTETVSIAQTQDLQKNPLYKIPLLVDFYYDGKKERRKITIEKMNEDFVFHFPAKPDLVNVDAEKMLLCTKEDNKMMSEFVFQFYHAPLYLDRYEALAKIGTSYAVNSPEAKVVSDALNDSFWNIRNMAIKNSGELAKSGSAVVRDKLATMALKDDKSDVRVAALNALAKYYKTDSLMIVYEQALHDSSYDVVDAAFTIIGDKDETKGMELAKKFEQEKDPGMIGAVGIYYAEKGKEENNDYLLYALDHTKGLDQYTLVGEYAKFMIRLTELDKMKPGIEKLAEIGRHGSSSYTRGKAVNTLELVTAELDNRIANATKEILTMKIQGKSQNEMMIEESKMEKIKMQKEQLKEIIGDIKKNEKDKRLIRSYQTK